MGLLGGFLGWAGVGEQGIGWSYWVIRMATKEEEQVATVAPAKPKAEPQEKVKRLPPYAVILLNDNRHTFQYVIDAIKKTFGYSTFKAMRLAMRAHVSGRSLVWVGSKEVAEFKRERLRGFGPDIYAMGHVDFPLRCEIEPME